MLAEEGSQPRQIEMCWLYICPQANFVVGEGSLGNLKLFFHRRKPLVMMGMHKLPILSLGVICPWVAPGVKKSAGTRSLWTKTEDPRGAGGKDESKNNFMRMWRMAFSLLLKAKKGPKPTGHELQCPWAKAHPYLRRLRNQAMEK